MQSEADNRVALQTFEEWQVRVLISLLKNIVEITGGLMSMNK